MTGSKASPKIWLLAAALAVSAAAPAGAFTYQDGGSASSSDRKFDVEEQARQFRGQGFDASTRGNSQNIETPWGKGTMTFGTQRGGLTSWGSSTVRREQMDRMLAPPGLQYRYD